MKKKSIVLAVLAVMVCGVVWGAIWLGGAAEHEEQPVRGSSVFVTWSESFSSVREMEAAADLGIVGVLAGSETELRGGVVFTRNTVEVVAVYSGEAEVGDFVEVLQTGGEYGGVSTPALEELPLMEADKEYALFLKETRPHEEYGQYYLIAGGYLGIAEIPAGTSEERDGTVEFTEYFAGNFE